MTTILITPPAVEPISLAQGRAWLKETNVGDDIDEKIMLAIRAVREVCENDCRRSFISQQWKLVLDRFPGPNSDISSANQYGPAWGTGPGPLSMLGAGQTSGYELYLPHPPIISVDAIEFTDPNGVLQSLIPGTDPAVSLATSSDLAEGLLVPSVTSNWPGTSRGSRVAVIYTAGYGTDASAVPACAILWMRQHLGTVYETVQSEQMAWRETLTVSPFSDRLLDPIRMRRY